VAERRASLMHPRMEHLLDRVDSKFTLGKIVPPQVTSVSRKPLTISLEEIEIGKIEAVPLPDPDAETGDEAEASGTDPLAAAVSETAE
jgi:DNA-directed RNA polymerase subunit omega